MSDELAKLLIAAYRASLDFCDKGFWQEVIATIVGVALGVLASLWLDRRIRSHTEAVELKRIESERAERKHRLLSLIRSGIEHQVREVPAIRRILLPQTILSVWVSTAHLDATVREQQELLDVGLVESLEKFRAMLVQGQDLLKWRMDVQIAPHRTAGAGIHLEAELRRMLFECADELVEHGGVVLERLRKEMGDEEAPGDKTKATSTERIATAPH